MPATVDYHWTMAIRWQDAASHAHHADLDGVVPVPSAADRQTAYRAIREIVGNAVGVAKFCVIQFSLEPNRLTPAGPTSTTLSDRQRPGER